jgi:hypothetical protein
MGKGDYPKAKQIIKNNNVDNRNAQANSANYDDSTNNNTSSGVSKGDAPIKKG